MVRITEPMAATTTTIPVEVRGAMQRGEAHGLPAHAALDDRHVRGLFQHHRSQRQVAAEHCVVQRVEAPAIQRPQTLEVLDHHRERLDPLALEGRQHQGVRLLQPLRLLLLLLRPRRLLLRLLG